MKNQVRNFLEIMKLELEDLAEDIQILKEECEQRNKTGQITNYVYMENRALYENELHAIKSFRRMITAVDHHQFPKLDPLIDHLRTNFQTIMQSCGYAEAGKICIERKMLKVARYISGPQLSS